MKGKGELSLEETLTRVFLAMIGIGFSFACTGRQNTTRLSQGPGSASKRKLSGVVKEGAYVPSLPGFGAGSPEEGANLPAIRAILKAD